MSDQGFTNADRNLLHGISNYLTGDEVAKPNGNNGKRLDIYFHADSGAGGQKDDVLPVLCEFIGQVYQKLDWIISQNEQILAGGGGDTSAQAQIDALTERVKQSDAGLEASMKEEKEKHGNS